MKHKVDELEGALLDAAVAKAEGFDFVLLSDCMLPERMRTGDGRFRPSVLWAEAGPIIDREGITVVRMFSYNEDGSRPTPAWYAWVLDAHNGAGPYFDVVPRGAVASGPTYLIAAMRAYVVSQLGEEVELTC